MTKLSRVSGPASTDPAVTAARDAYEAEICHYPNLRHVTVHQVLAPNGRVTCPVCRCLAQGVLRIALSTALIERTRDGVRWAGYSDHWWDTAITLRKGGLPILTCENGHLFTHPTIAEEPEE